MPRQFKAHYKNWSYPWFSRSYSPGIIGLHEEIKDFCSYMQPTLQEKQMREHVIQSVNTIVTKLWPKAKLEVFGSFSTGLYLPTSDIDLVILGEWKYLPLFTLKEAIINAKLASRDFVQVIERAVVPIVKFEHINTEINVDICFNKINGLKSALFIKECLKKYPHLLNLVLVLKQFLLMRDLNEVFAGGLGSYALFLLCVSFLQLHPRCDANNSSANTGVLLVEFLEFYGEIFNYDSACICVRNGGSYIKKEKFQKEIQSLSNTFLCIEDPIAVENDVCKSSYAMEQVKEAFSFAYHLLTINLCKQHYFQVKSPVPSYLGLIIKLPKRWLMKRKKIIKKWKDAHHDKKKNLKRSLNMLKSNQTVENTLFLESYVSEPATKKSRRL